MKEVKCIRCPNMQTYQINKLWTNSNNKTQTKCNLCNINKIIWIKRNKKLKDNGFGLCLRLKVYPHAQEVDILLH